MYGLQSIAEANDELLDYLEEQLSHVDDEEPLYFGDFDIYETNEDMLFHYGVGPDDNPPGRGSGRYAKGTGENPMQHDKGLAAQVSALKKQGVSASDIAKGLGFRSTVDLRQAIHAEKNAREKEHERVIPEMKAAGKSIKEISEATGLSQSSVRNYLNTERKLQYNRTNTVADRLEQELLKKRYIDVGKGVELEIGCSKVRLDNAVAALEEKGYKKHKVKVPQLGNPDQFTTITVLGDKDTEWKEVVKDPSLIKSFTSYFENDGDTGRGLQKPKSIDASRVYIRYTDESGKGGAERDGLIELRRGVKDLSLGNSNYSQVRIAVNDDHYMKGMAVYSDDIPDGYDVIYNSNKKYGTDPNKVFKPMKTTNGKDDGPIDWDNPFGATIKPLTAGGQSYYEDENGNKQLSLINKVNDQGDWAKWSKTISSQILSKQPTKLVQKQLNETFKDKKAEYDEIISLTNPTVKRKLLESFADDCDSSAAHLKAKAFPNQAYYVILPVPSLKGDESYSKKNGGKIDGEVYAPKYENGEILALFRSPHAHTSEIPFVKVNNNNKEAKAMLGQTGDAIAINAHIAERLSGADFDGDTVIAVPLKTTQIKNSPQLEQLKGFNTKSYAFPDPDHAKIISSQEKQKQMGMITNLITDMSFRDGVTADEMARAIKHSMVVIDSEKHKLDYKKSAIDNGIAQLKAKYQQDADTGKVGAGTIISRAGSEVHVPQRKLGSIVDPETGKTYYHINPKTGEKIWVETGYTKKVKSPTQKDPDRMKEVLVTQKLDRMDIEKDARNLMSSRTNPHPTEVVYANYANQLKALANEARKAYVSTERLRRDPIAAKEYAQEVSDLKDKLIRAQKNAPKERIAQAIAASNYKNALDNNPSLKEDKEHLKRLRGQYLTGARNRVGAHKEQIDITDREWEAIQHRAISETMLMDILKNAKEDRVRQLATPRRTQAVPANIEAGIRVMAARPNGPTLQQIAEQYGISASTVSKIVNGG